MGYTPKSKYKIKEASKGELIYKLSRKPYIGSYIEFSSGKIYAGNNPNKLKNQLLKKSNESDLIGKDNNINTHIFLNKDTFKYLSKTQSPTYSKPKPTKKDYKIGHFNRYFLKKVNEQVGFMEINKKTYKSLRQKEGKYDHLLYQAGSITWSITNSHKESESVFNSNFLSVQKLERDFPLLSTFFNTYNEYTKINLPPSTINETNEKELLKQKMLEFEADLMNSQNKDEFKDKVRKIKHKNKMVSAYRNIRKIF